MSQHYDDEINASVGMASLKGAYRSMNKIMYNWNCLLLPLPQNSYLVAKSLFLNNHDINIIYKSYLKMWSIDKSVDYVPTLTFVLKIGKDYNHLIFKFFNTNQMSYESYFIFVCIFIFYDISHIALLLLSMTNIFTSDYIKVEEISQLFTEYEINHNLVEMCAVLGVERRKDPDCPLDSYLLTDFLIYLNKSKRFLDYIEGFRKKLIKCTMSRGLYDSIIAKCNYFYTNPNCTSYPKEGCFSCVSRKLNGLPKPYYSEYGTTDPALYALSEIISVLRDRFINIYKEKKEKDRMISYYKSPDISQNDLNRMIQLSMIEKPVSTSKRNSLIYSNMVRSTPTINHRTSVKSLQILSKNVSPETVNSKRRSIQVLPVHETK